MKSPCNLMNVTMRYFWTNQKGEGCCSMRELWSKLAWKRAEWGTQKCVVYFKIGTSTYCFGSNLDALGILSNHPFPLIILGLYIRIIMAFGLACRPLQTATHGVTSQSRDWLWRDVISVNRLSYCWLDNWKPENRKHAVVRSLIG